jgi:hypothetical protein
MCKSWQENVENFLRKNHLEGFIGFEEQFKKLKNLNELDNFLETKLTFKKTREDIRLYILKVLEKNNWDYMESLYLAIGQANLEEVFKECENEKLTHIRLQKTFGKGAPVHTGGNGDYLTLRGKEELDKLSINTSQQTTRLNTAEISHPCKLDSLRKNFLGLSQSHIDVLNQRILETKKCMENDIPLAAILLTGSTLEGILLFLAEKNPEAFNKSTHAPKKKEKVLAFSQWTLTDLIEVCVELKYFREDVKKFIIPLRDFRNYIHPREQIKTEFNPDMHTANMCLEALLATIDTLNSKEEPHQKTVKR